MEPGALSCGTCGGSFEVPRVPVARAIYVRRCPRCSYQGDGIPYFRRTRNVGFLLAIGIFSWGVAALIYWLVARGNRICPSCGLDWGLSLPPGGNGSEPPPARRKPPSLPRRGLGRRILGTLTILFASFMMIAGLVETELAAVIFGSFIGLAGAGTFWWGWKSLEARRQALLASLQRQVVRLAKKKGGTLTVTDVAAHLDLSLEAAEKVLIAMDDGFRVRSEITRDGILFYEFPEVKHQGHLKAGPGL